MCGRNNKLALNYTKPHQVVLYLTNVKKKNQDKSKGFISKKTVIIVKVKCFHEMGKKNKKRK